MNAQLSFVHALSALHAGVGQGAGVIDLPIAREKATGLPFLPGSSVKGALRTRAFLDANENKDLKALYTCIFGPENNDGPDARASMVQFSDQKLLLLPVRSLAGTFAWITSPYILRRLARDSRDIGLALPDQVPTIPTDEKKRCLITNGGAAIVMPIKGEKKVYLEDLELEMQADDGAREWAKWIGSYVFPVKQDGNDKDTAQKNAENTAWQTILNDRFCVVHDDVFNFLITTATEVTARIRLQENSKTVVDGGLWYEEALPTETILSGIVMATPHKDENGHAIQIQGHDLTAERIFKALKGLGNTTIQLGGKATVGRGICHVQLVDNAEEK
ncbi:MAG TPA: type III-B CRISPR module RAMP protein Cmr4 [Ktedonobacteraceae bacterium]|nr:type III-B CRISPR module RAMP protein Cmr4 [Ktedonobacteraceae bacterium]